MTKYTHAFKQQVIEFYLQCGKNRSLTRQHFQIKDTTFRHWLAQYNHSGFKGLAVSHTKQVYSPEFKLSVVQAVKNGVFSTRKPPCISAYLGLLSLANGCKSLINTV